MQISILNYNKGQIEVYDISQYQQENYPILNDIFDKNYVAENWLIDNGFNSDEVEYMITDECPLCVVNNVETHLNL